MEEEVWKDVVGYDGIYKVSNVGRIKSLCKTIRRSNGSPPTTKERILKGTLNNIGYFTVSLWKNGYKKTMRVHQLVANSFLFHTPDGHKLVVDHINGDKTDNRVENLRIVTSRFNNTEGFLKNKSCFASQYIGVCWYNKSKKWLARIDINGRPKYLGLFEKEIDASNAYQKELLKLK